MMDQEEASLPVVPSALWVSLLARARQAGGALRWSSFLGVFWGLAPTKGGQPARQAGKTSEKDETRDRSLVCCVLCTSGPPFSWPLVQSLREKTLDEQWISGRRTLSSYLIVDACVRPHTHALYRDQLLLPSAPSLLQITSNFRRSIATSCHVFDKTGLVIHLLLAPTVVHFGPGQDFDDV